MRGVELVLAFLAGVVMSGALDRFVLPLVRVVAVPDYQISPGILLLLLNAILALSWGSRLSGMQGVRWRQSRPCCQQGLRPPDAGCSAANLSRRGAPVSQPHVRWSVDDLASFILADRRQPVTPCLKRRGGLSRPVGHLAHDPERLSGAVGPGWVAGELLVGHVWVVLERPRWLNDVDARSTFARGELCGEPAPSRRAVK